MKLRASNSLGVGLSLALLVSLAPVTPASATTQPSPSAPLSAVAAPAAPIGLETNSSVNPLGIGTAPHLSWRAQVDRQSAYEIEVGSAPGLSDVWKSGKVTGSRSTYVPYEGPAQTSQQDYFWRVRVWDAAGTASAWSDGASWETGLLAGEADWAGAQWIGGQRNRNNDWTDMVETVKFRGKTTGGNGLNLLFHAQPVGKTWGESYSWALRSTVGTTVSTAVVAAGATSIPVAGVDNWHVGDTVVVGRGTPDAQTTTVTSVGTATVNTRLLVPPAAGDSHAVVPAGVALAAGAAATLNGQRITITSVTDAAGYAVVSFTPALTANAPSSATLFSLGSGLGLADPVTTARPVGTSVYGIGTMNLVATTNHYAGNTGVPGGTPAVQWGVNYYDPQSETNPTAVGTRKVAVATVPIPASTGLTTDTWDTRDHTVKIQVKGETITTTINGTVVDSRTVTGDQVRSNGSIGFGPGGAATITSVSVTGDGSADFHTDLTKGANPFESGIAGIGGLTFSTNNIMLPMASANPLLRKTFTTDDKEIASARLYAAAGGEFVLSVNGTQVTTDGEVPAADGHNVPRMLPDHSSYDKTVLYSTFDVTRFLKPGRETVLAAELGRGWYGVTTPNEWYWNLANYAGDPRFRGKLVVNYTDGTSDTVVTNTSWLTTDGPTTFDSIYSGEKYNAARAITVGSWRKPGYSGAGWTNATQAIAPGSCTPSPNSGCHGALPYDSVPAGFVPATLKADETEPVLVSQNLKPVSINETFPGSGVYVVDFGQILTGFPVINLTGVTPDKAGYTVRMRGGNSVTGTGSATSPLVVDEENNFHDANLQTNYYTVGSTRNQIWENQFSQWGFRYMEVRNIDQVLGHPLSLASDPDLFSVNVARTGFVRTGSFDTDSPLINRITSNLEWAEQNNLFSKPTDTPSREKNGWTGDAVSSTETESMIWDVNGILTRYLLSFPDNQSSTGQVPMILPAAKGGYGFDRTPGWNYTWKAVPAWDSAFFVVPWELYTYYGNTTLFEPLFDSQDKMLQYYETLFLPANNYKFTSALGEYSGAGAAGDSAVINLQFYIHFADYMSTVGTLIGKNDRATHYKALATKLRAAFVANYWDNTTRTFIGGNVESENAMAIEFDLVPGSDLDPADPLYLAGTGTQAQNKANVAKRVADSIINAGYHLQAGMYGSKYEFNILDDYGYTDVVLKASTVLGAPGYADQIAQGATSLWENWTGGSLNHHYRDNIATWFYQGLAGIMPTDVAWGTARIRPFIPTVDANKGVPTSPSQTSVDTGPLNKVEAHIDTVNGTIASKWNRLTDGRIHLTVQVPHNTPTEIWVPTQDKAVVAPAGATHLRSDAAGGKAYEVYSVPAGTWEFNGTPEKATSTTAITTSNTIRVSPAVTSIAVAVTGTSADTSGAVTIKDGSKVLGAGTVNAGGTGKITLAAPLKAGDHRLSATYAGNATTTGSTGTSTLRVYFADHPPKSDFFDDVQWLATRGITTGFDGTNFKPASGLARDAVAAWLYRLTTGKAKAPACTAKPAVDVPISHPLCGEIAWMYQQGITTGNTGGKFLPSGTVTRDQAVVFLHRLKTGRQGGACTDGKPFPDISASDPFCQAVKWAAATGITTGNPDGRFRPTETASRQAVAAFFHRYANLAG
ncbi:hypothetical protein D1871_15455 [Nakamurella silvestris]|nr:hypothetical protein D1871_15455 [Nakamurella silvestris]